MADTLILVCNVIPVWERLRPVRLFATKMFPVDESDDKISSLKILDIFDHELIRVFLHFYGHLLSNEKL